MTTTTEVPITTDDLTIVSARPLHEPETDPYTGAPVEMGAALAPVRFDEAVTESVEAIPSRIADLAYLYAKRKGYRPTRQAIEACVADLFSVLPAGSH